MESGNKRKVERLRRNASLKKEEVNVEDGREQKDDKWHHVERSTGNSLGGLSFLRMPKWIRQRLLWRMGFLVVTMLKEAKHGDVGVG
ncbi:hypothetical protein E2542_SST01657 [Spatholobus suberectus]|nr:hypothetical protein E2542_SST01657 [Spatholobus suberectus]